MTEPTGSLFDMDAVPASKDAQRRARRSKSVSAAEEAVRAPAAAVLPDGHPNPLPPPSVPGPADERGPFDPPWQTDTIAQARAWLNARAEEGATCPACDQSVKVYRRALGTGMVRALIALHHDAPGGQWANFTEVLARHRLQRADEAKLVYWGLIEADGGKRADGSNRTGFYRITRTGTDFVLNRTTVPRYAVVYNGRLITVEGDPVGVAEALGKRFDYDELMNA